MLPCLPDLTWNGPHCPSRSEPLGLEAGLLVRVDSPFLSSPFLSDHCAALASPVER